MEQNRNSFCQIVNEIQFAAAELYKAWAQRCNQHSNSEYIYFDTASLATLQATLAQTSFTQIQDLGRSVLSQNQSHFTGVTNYFSEEWEPTRSYLLFYCPSYRLNMFRTLLCPSSGTIACSPDTTPAYPHLTSNLHQPKNGTTNVIINIIVVSSWWWA